MLEKFRGMLGRPVDGGSLAVFRILFGLTIAWMLGRAIDSAEFDNYFRTASGFGYAFAYPGLSWVQPLPPPWMTVWLATALGLAIALAFGFCYRVTVVLSFVSFAYVMHMDRTLYGNHLVLAAVLGFLLLWMPAHRRYAVDRWFWPKSRDVLGDPPGTVPFWTVFLLRAQVLVIYFFGGISKLHPDWLATEPVRTWFRTAADAAERVPAADRSLSQNFDRLLGTEEMIYFVTYGGLVFDLVIGFLLLFRRTRILGITLASGFHLFNFFRVENVGRVAVLAFAGTLMFLEPDWPDRFARWFKKPFVKRPDLGWLIGGAILLPGVGALLGWKLAPSGERVYPLRQVPRWISAAVLLWITAAVLLPLRHLVIPGDAYWTEEGVRYSWFLLTRNKIGGFLQFSIEDKALFKETAEGKWTIDWSEWRGDRPRVTYQEVDPRQVPWYTMPEFFVTYEPLFGERIFFNTGATNFVGFDQARAYAEKRWVEMYGRKPDLILPTFPLYRVLDADIEPLAARQESLEPRQRQILSALVQLRQWAERMRNRDASNDAFRWQIFSEQMAITALAQIAHADRNFLNRALTISPFDLQGNPTPPIAPLLVIDRTLLDQGKDAIWTIDRSLWRGSDIDYVALGLLLPQHLLNLPEILFVRDPAGRPKAVWNYARELTMSQIQHLGIVPSIVQQYAEHIADEWEVKQGRRPEVRATVYARLNNHPFQLLVDPEADLASQPAGPLTHGQWITEMKP